MRVLVAARVQDLSDAPYNGWVERHRLVIGALGRRADLTFITIRFPGDMTCVRPDLPGGPTWELAGRHQNTDKSARLARLAGRADEHELVPMLADVVEQAGCDVALTFGPWLDRELEPLRSRLPSVHVMEEDVGRMPENAPQSRQSRLLRSLERATQRRAPHPTVAIVISTRETAAARSRYGSGCRVEVIPQTLDPTKWPATPVSATGTGGFLLTVGAMDEARNAEGLADFLHHWRRPGAPPVVVVSGRGLHPLLHDAVARGGVTVHTDLAQAQVRDLYDGATAALVPATRATGMKATVLQAWQCGVPVGALRASAQTYPPEHGAAVLTASTPADLADAIRDLWLDEGARQGWVSAGARAAAAYNHETWMVHTVDLVLDLARPAPNRSAPS